MVQPRAAPLSDVPDVPDVPDLPEADAQEAPWDAQPERRSAEVSQALHGQRLDKAVVTMAEEFSDRKSVV